MAAIPALFKGAHTGPSPVDRGRAGSKHHLIVDASGIPLAISLTGGKPQRCHPTAALVDGVGPVRGKVGRPRQRAGSLIADRGYDHDEYRRGSGSRGVKPIIARRSTVHGSGLERMRWVIERTLAWLHFFRRLLPTLSTRLMKQALKAQSEARHRPDLVGSGRSSVVRFLGGRSPVGVSARS